MTNLSPDLLKLIKDAKNKYSGGNAKTVKVKEGKTRVRILHKPGENTFFFENAVHWIKTEKNGKPIAVVGCDYHVNDKPCAICTAIDKALQAAKAIGDDEQASLIGEWKAKKSILVNALILDGPDASPDPQILELTQTAFSGFLAIVEEYSSDVNVLDPESGIDVVIERRGKGYDTTYTVLPQLKSKPVDTRVFSKMNDLRAFVEKEFFRGDETKALNAIAQVTGVKVAALPSARASALLSKPVDDVIEETVVEDPPFETEKPAPAPAATTTRAKKAAKPVEDEDLDSILKDLDDL